MYLETFLVSLYVLIDDWWGSDRPPTARKPGRPPRLTDSEVLTLAKSPTVYRVIDTT